MNCQSPGLKDLQNLREWFEFCRELERSGIVFPLEIPIVIAKASNKYVYVDPASNIFKEFSSKQELLEEIQRHSCVQGHREPVLHGDVILYLVDQNKVMYIDYVETPISKIEKALENI